MSGKCPKCGDELHWYPAINEEGWRCCSCDFKPGEPAGYDPRLDVELIEVKVGGLLMDLHGNKLIHISNGSHGDGVTASVSESCRKLHRFDQLTICRLIFDDDGYSEYWASIGDSVRSGNDTRDRCSGGSLSTGSSGTGDGWRHWCSTKGCVCGGIGGPNDEVPF